MNLSEVTAKKNRLLKAKAVWDGIKVRLEIDDNTVTLVLAGDDERLDKMAIQKLNDFVIRKNASRAEILVTEESFEKYTVSKDWPYPVRFTKMEYEELCSIYEYYCFAFNLDNIAFTFLNQCHYNLMGRILNETDITEEEAVCLGVYWLRELQEKKVNV